MRQQLVSVLTPLYNAENYIDEVLSAVHNQTYPNIEHIIVDDGSTDHSAERVECFMKEFPSAPIHFLRQENAGEAAAVNRAFESSSGTYVVVVNADDPPMPRLVEEALQFLEADHETVVVYPDWEMIDAAGDSIRTVTTLEFSQQALIGDFVCLPGPGAVIRRNALGNNSLRDPRYRYVSDYELWLRLSLQGPMQRCPKVLATWRNHVAGATATGKGPVMAEEFVSVIDDFFARENLPLHVRAWKRQARSMVAYHAAIQKLHDPSTPGRRLMMRSLLRPFLRRASYSTVRRSPLVVMAVLGMPLSSAAWKWFR